MLFLADVAIADDIEKSDSRAICLEGKWGSHSILIDLTIDGVPLEKHWNQTFDAIFEFADSDGNDRITLNELPLVPSARSMRTALGSGFASPVAAAPTLEEILATDKEVSTDSLSTDFCTRHQLRNYYRHNRIGATSLARGRLSDAQASNSAILQHLDINGDGKLSKQELASAESILRKLDVNDDELIGIGELVVLSNYPAQLATSMVSPSSQVSLGEEGENAIRLSFPAMPYEATEASSFDRLPTPKRWSVHFPSFADSKAKPLSSSDSSTKVQNDSPLYVPMKNGEVKSIIFGWSVPGSAPSKWSDTAERIEYAWNHMMDSEEKEAADTQGRNQRDRLEWLRPMADRNGNGKLERDELDSWISLQSKICDGQSLLSLYLDGGIFEIIDSDRDAAWSAVELRNAWERLLEMDFVDGDQVDVIHLPRVNYLIASQGYPKELAPPRQSKVAWFQSMDRNSDGAVSKREFIGPLEKFQNFDANRDGLLSEDEARQVRPSN